MLHYFARQFYAPVLLSPLLNGTKVQLVFINETETTTSSPQVTKGHGESGPLKKDNTLRFDPSVNLQGKRQDTKLQGEFHQEIERGKKLIELLS